MLSIIMLLITIVYAGILMYNFDRGLKTQRAFCDIDDRRPNELFSLSGQKDQVQGHRSGAKRHGICASWSNAHTPQSNEHRLKSPLLIPLPYETDSVCASSICIPLMLFSSTEDPPHRLFHFLRTFPVYTTHLLPTGISLFFTLNPGDEHVDPWSQDF